MSFSVSNISSNNITSVSLSGSNGIASIDSGGIYYSNNLGANWTQSPSITGNFDSVFLSGSNGIAGSSSFDGLYYSTDSGVNWTQSDLTTGGATSGNFYTVALSGTNAIAASSFDDIGIYYSTNSGQTWTQSLSLTNGNFFSVALSGANGIAGSNSTNGIYYSTNSGQTWTRSTDGTNPITGDFYSVSLSGTNAIAGSFTGSGIYYSTNSGSGFSTWTQSNLTTGDFYSVFLSGANGVAGSGSDNDGIYYTTNSGQTWTKSNLIAGNLMVALYGSIAIATASNWTGSPNSSSGIYRSLNYGQTWTQTNISTGFFNSVSLSGSRAIAGGVSNNGIYYSSSPLCYGKNTLVLILENKVEVYKKICELKVGDTVKTYKHGYKKIKMIKSFNYNTYNITRLKRCVYRMKDHNVIVTGKHGLLVDELTEEEIKNIKKCGTFVRCIDDKQVLPACASDKFEKITDIFEFELWHFVLENDDESRNYGIYITDGILSESCSEKAFLNA
jgi:photosystem II stability/assembly factor-like uncharacterized protein